MNLSVAISAQNNTFPNFAENSFFVAISQLSNDILLIPSCMMEL